MTVARTRLNLLSARQAAERLGCSRAHIYALVEKKKLTPYYIGINGGSLRVSDEDVDRFIKESAGKPSSGAA